MKAHSIFIFLVIFMISNSQAQFPIINPNWKYIRADNTGVGGEQHFVVRGDRFGNIWTGGRIPFWSQGCVTRFDGQTFTNWGTYAENYLPNEIINNIAFDYNDRIWVGTDQGLATSADGLTWQHYTSGNCSLIRDQIKGIAIEPDNDIWVVTGEQGNGLIGGVGFFDGTTWNFYTSVNSGLPSEQLTDVAIDQNGIIWITCNIGLIKFDGLTWTQYNTGNSGISPGAPREVMVDSLNRVWICNGPNIDIFDGVNWSQINNSVWPVANFNATSMYIRGDKIVLSETTNTSRVMMFDGVNWSWQWTNDFIINSYIDLDGNYWTAGANAVKKFENGQVTNYTRYSTALCENMSEDLFIDSKNNKWIANGNGGIQVFDCPDWEIYGILNESLFPVPQTQSYVGSQISETADGDIWFTYNGSDGFAVQVPNGDYQNYASWVVWDKSNAHPWFQGIKKIAGTDSGKVFCIADFTYNTFMYDKATNSWTLWDITNGITGWPKCLASKPGGQMYICHSGGIDIYDNTGWTTIDVSSIGISDILDIEFDNFGNLWLGTVEGLWKYDGLSWVNWNITNSNIAANTVTSIKIDTITNTIFISAEEAMNFPYYGGISYFNGLGNTFITHLYGSSGISEKYVRDLDIDTLGNLWILTAGEGINVYNPMGVIGFDCIDKSLQTGNTTNVEPLASEAIQSAVVFPNPLTSSAEIRINLLKGIYVSIVILDVQGKIVRKFDHTSLMSGNNTFLLDLENVEAGVYTCKIQSSEMMQTIKIAKLKK
ncbi:MAG: T9SS type A sorting domain-containing protein [Bacteroidia bacterium]|nr:T9SS type A sorting domain-containing protein [Bacteroidota bacterium]MBP9082723.1 T9SS type A sorting domain-containing protein [Bacteroidia bacterium]